MDDEKAQNGREERQHTGMHVVGNEGAQQQHTVRPDDEHERQGSIGGRRRAYVRMKLIQLIRSVAERTKAWNVARATKEGGH